MSSKESIKTAYLHLTTIGKHQVTEDGVCDGLNGHWDDGVCVAVAKYGRLNCPQTEEKRKKNGQKLNNCAINCANGDAFVRRGGSAHK